MRNVKAILLVSVLFATIGIVSMENAAGNEARSTDFASSVITSIPRTMTYQGILKDSSGVPLADSSVSITFRIYDDPVIGTQEWIETGVAVQTNEGGYFSATLTNLNISFDEDYWLELEIDGDALDPRQKLNMTAYAAAADTSDYSFNSDMLDGQQASDFASVTHDHDADYVNEGQANSVTSGMIVDGTIQFSDIGQNGASSDQVMKWNGTAWVAANDSVGGGGGWEDNGTIVRLEDNTDYVGIGTTNPGFKLSVGSGIVNQVHPAHRLVVTDSSNSRLGVYVKNKGISIDVSDTTFSHIYAFEYGGGPLDLILNHAGGKVGIGTTSPDQKLHVAGTIQTAGFKMPNGAANGYVLASDPTGVASWQPIPNSISCEDCNNTFVNVTGPDSVSASTSGPTLRGINRGNGYGIKGESYGSTSNEIIGVVGHSDNSSTGNAIGVGGVATNTSSGWIAGGYFTGTGLGSGTHYGVFATTAGGSESFAGYFNGSSATYAGKFNGDVHVTGTLSKGGGSFKIDHPLDPENKYLYHSFVESPDMMNIYNGNVILDGSGEAEVELPEWFEILNSDFRYQLTCIGGFAPVYIAEKIQNNRFKIAGGQPAMEISWQVTGIRHDKFAEANRIQVEVDKSAKKRGKYIHPEAYGLGVEYGIDYEEHKRMEEKRFERGEK